MAIRGLSPLSAAWSQDCQTRRQSASVDRADGELCQKPYHVITRKTVRLDAETFFIDPLHKASCLVPALQLVDAALSEVFAISNRD